MLIPQIQQGGHIGLATPGDVLVSSDLAEDTLVFTFLGAISIGTVSPSSVPSAGGTVLTVDWHRLLKAGHSHL